MTILINSKWKLKRDNWLSNQYYKKGSIAVVKSINISEHVSFVTLLMNDNRIVQINVHDLIDKYKGE